LDVYAPAQKNPRIKGDNMNRAKFLRAVLPLLACAFLGGPAAADPFPSKPIRIIASTPPGGNIDLVSRLIAQKLPAYLGQPVVVENKAGAAGNIATEYVAHAPADGYTLLVVASSHATNLNLYPKLGFDPVKDFAPVSLLTKNGFVVAVPASSPANTFREFLALAKAKKGALNYASAGAGQGNHLGMELLKNMAGFDATHVPFSGVGPATTALLAGQVDVSLLTPVGAVPYMKGGRLKVLATTGKARSPFLPDVPTVAESGVPGYELTGWIAMLAPAGTPKDVVARLQRESARALRDPDVLKQLQLANVEPVGSTPEEFAPFLKSEIATWAKVIKQSGARLD
jgi:tripartite-type tricarboxylate transporter receptor subunit TctC